MDDAVGIDQVDERLSRYGEAPTEADIDPRAAGAPLFRFVLAFRLMTDAERDRLAWPGWST